MRGWRTTGFTTRWWRESEDRDKDNDEAKRNDTLTNDWDILRELNPAKKPSFDAIVANPPFSYRWEPTDALADDVRFKNHGLAPKSAADFAFLLHGFHFLKDEGVMAIILPHGVLFRGGAEERIRTKLLKGERSESNREERVQPEHLPLHQHGGGRGGDRPCANPCRLGRDRETHPSRHHQTQYVSARTRPGPAAIGNRAQGGLKACGRSGRNPKEKIERIRRIRLI